MMVVEEGVFKRDEVWNEVYFFSFWPCRSEFSSFFQKSFCILFLGLKITGKMIFRCRKYILMFLVEEGVFEVDEVLDEFFF